MQTCPGAAEHWSVLNAKNALRAAISLAVCSLVGIIYSALKPIDSNGVGQDSYGRRLHGYRAMYETLAELGVPMRRLLTPPMSHDGEPETIVLWAPFPPLVSQLATNLDRLVTWVEAGGRLVVSPYAGAVDSTGDQAQFGIFRATSNVLEALEIRHVALQSILPRTGEAAGPLDQSTRLAPGRLRDDLAGVFRDDSRPLPQITLSTHGEGSLAALADRARELSVPADGMQSLTLSPDAVTNGVFFAVNEQGERYPLAAEIPRGKGAIVVVSEPRLLANVYVQNGDNAVLGADLWTAEGQRVAVDELFHGLSVQGNPFFLVGELPFAALSLGMILACAVALWRGGVYLGPPGEPLVISRRTIAEYVEAMGRFISRSRNSRRFILREVREGVLRSLANKLGVRGGHERVEALAAVLERKDPAAAQQLRGAVQFVDSAIAGKTRLNEQGLITALQRIQACL